MEGECLEGDERVKGGCAGDIDQGQTGYDSPDEEKSIDWKFERRPNVVSQRNKRSRAGYIRMRRSWKKAGRYREQTPTLVSRLKQRC